MEQTFDDLCNEQQGRLFSLTLHISIDTGIGIGKEQILHLSKRSTMSSLLKNPKTAAIVGVMLFLPGVVMLSLLMLGIEPTLGSLAPYLQPPNDGPHILGSLIVLSLILVLPAVGVIVNVAATEGNAVKSIFSNLGSAVIISLLVVLPLIIMELVFGRDSYSNFPWPLFGILWLLPVMFIVIFAPIIQSVRAGNSILANPITLVLRVGFLFLIAIMWCGILIDQMPCFLGVPNCD